MTQTSQLSLAEIFFMLCGKKEKKPHSFQWDYPSPDSISHIFLHLIFLSCTLFHHKTMLTRIMTPTIWKISRKRFFRVSITTRMAKSTARSSRWFFWLWLKCPPMNNKFDIVESKQRANDDNKKPISKAQLDTKNTKQKYFSLVCIFPSFQNKVLYR